VSQRACDNTGTPPTTKNRQSDSTGRVLPSKCEAQSSNASYEEREREKERERERGEEMGKFRSVNQGRGQGRWKEEGFRILEKHTKKICS
jgi:hypothetical protein